MLQAFVPLIASRLRYKYGYTKVAFAAIIKSMDSGSRAEPFKKNQQQNRLTLGTTI
jgi:hypothetical protein